jgi:hypothetical protein
MNLKKKSYGSNFQMPFSSQHLHLLLPWGQGLVLGEKGTWKFDIQFYFFVFIIFNT